MFTPTYLIISLFAIGAVTFAALGIRQARVIPTTPAPATHPAILKKAA